MGAVEPGELARLWAQEGLTTEQAVGQMVQCLVTMQTTVERQAVALAQLRAEIAALGGSEASCTEHGKRGRRAR